MIQNTNITRNFKIIKETSVILHDYILTKNKSTYDYTENNNPNINDGKRHRTRSFVISYDDNPYPSVTKLKNMLNNAKITNHSNITNSIQYGKNLINFCPKCLSTVKNECNKKFGGGY